MATRALQFDRRLDDGIALIERRLQPEAVLLYGSLASGETGPHSDVDIGLLMGRREVDPFELSALRTDVEAVVGRDVDLVALDTASPILAMEVLRRHRVAHARRPAAVDEFFVRTCGAYFDLKCVRRPIEDAIRRRATAA